MDLKKTLESAVESGNVQEKIEGATGKYEDKVASDTATEGKLPYASLPKGTDPSPFSIGKVGGEK